MDQDAGQVGRASDGSQDPGCLPDAGGGNVPQTGALPGAPLAGEFFPDLLASLLANAWPPL